MGGDEGGAGQAFTQVDAFADDVFRGNPAAVFVLDGPADPAWMQAVALEMNLSETAFCHPRPVDQDDGGPGEWDLRWFTPTDEVDLCGHATLATAHTLTSDHGATGEIGFHTRSGRLAAVATDGGIRLDFPVDVLEAVPVTEAMVAAVGSPVVGAAKGGTDLLLELPTAADVRSCAPDIGLVAGLAERAVIVTSGCDDRAHTTLAAWWAPRLGDSFRAEQASSRGGELDVRLVGDRVHLTGRAVTVVRGRLLA